MKSLKIAIADDHGLVREGITRLLETLDYTVSHVCENGQEIVEYCKQEHPNIVLMDVNMPIMDGIAATKAIRNICPNTSVIALSMLDDDLTLIRMMKAGAKSYIPKEAPADELDNAIKSVHENGYYYSDFVSNRLINSLGAKHEDATATILDSMTTREMEFLKLSCSGLTYKEIADRMCVSPRSVDGYRDSLFQKLEARSRVELAIFAIKHNLVQI